MFQREDRYELRYISLKDGTEKRCYPRSKAKRDEQLAICKERGITVVSCKKLYPFSTMKNQHNFELIYNICFNQMGDMEMGDIEWNSEEYDRLAARRDKAGEFRCMELPVVWVPWETFQEMREMAAAAECHRDAACALAEAEREARREADRSSDWRPGDAPWNAPGMSVSDFI